MTNRKKVVPRYQIVIGLILGLSALATGGLATSSERSVILTQRFVPDGAHNIPLPIKGKIFYVDKKDQDTYYFYEHLFLGMIGFVFAIGLTKFMWGGYKKTREIGQNRRASRK
jgi:hypothetical protein